MAKLYGGGGAALGASPIQRDYMLDPRRQLMLELMKSGTSTDPVQSPLEGLSRALTAGLGGYFGGQAREEMQGREQRLGSDMARVLAGGQVKPWVDPDTGQTSTAPAGGYAGMMAAGAGLENPDIAPFMQQVAMGKIGAEETARGEERKFARDVALTQMKDKVSMQRKLEELLAADTLARRREADKPYLEMGLTPPGTAGGMTTGGDAGEPKPQKTLVEAQAEKVGAEEKARAEAKAGVKRTEMMPKAQAALSALERQAATIAGTDKTEGAVDRALKLISPWSTGWGSFLEKMPESDAGALENELRTIRSNIGFDKLQEMRQNSPTGGALGAVSDKEMALLQAVQGALDTKQSAQLKQNLTNIKNLYPQVIAEQRSAFDADYGQRESSPQSKKITEYDYVPGRGLVPRGQ